ncbi:MAG: hypothetical protein EOS11_04765 [Mesorhizobium sp.]|nr:MAG: hypothetical protein EOS11_04765 [Mesorhizobium sp.]
MTFRRVFIWIRKWLLGYIVGHAPRTFRACDEGQAHRSTSPRALPGAHACLISHAYCAETNARGVRYPRQQSYLTSPGFRDDQIAPSTLSTRWWVGTNFDVEKLFLKPDFGVTVAGVKLTGKAELDPWLIAQVSPSFLMQRLSGFGQPSYKKGLRVRPFSSPPARHSFRFSPCLRPAT